MPRVGLACSAAAGVAEMQHGMCLDTVEHRGLRRCRSDEKGNEKTLHRCSPPVTMRMDHIKNSHSFSQQKILP